MDVRPPKPDDFQGGAVEWAAVNDQGLIAESRLTPSLGLTAIVPSTNPRMGHLTITNIVIESGNDNEALPVLKFRWPGASRATLNISREDALAIQTTKTLPETTMAVIKAKLFSCAN